MPLYKVSYSMDVLYEVDVEAENEEDAKSKVNAGDFDSSKECVCGSEMLGVNMVELIKE